MALTKFGEKTKTVFLNEAESHKLHLAFTVADEQSVQRGQPCKLDEDGNILPIANDGTEDKLIIGYSIHNAEEGDEATLAMVGYAVIFAMSGAALNPGPARYSGVNGTDGTYTNYVTVAAGADDLYPGMNGWAIDAAAGANELIRVILK